MATTRNAAELFEHIARQATFGKEVRIEGGEFSLESPLTLPPLANFTLHAPGVTIRKTRDFPGPAIESRGWQSVTIHGMKIVGTDTEEKWHAVVRETNAKKTEPTLEQMGCGWRFIDPKGLRLNGVETEALNNGVIISKPQDLVADRLKHVGHWSGKISKQHPTTGVYMPIGKDLVRTCYGLRIMGGVDVTVTAHRADHAGGGIAIGTTVDGIKYGIPKNFTFTRCTGNMMGDNGIYISSAEGATVDLAEYSNVIGHAAKARGSRNVIKNSKATKSKAGFMLEPLSDKVDSSDSAMIGNYLEEVDTYPLYTDEAIETEIDPKTGEERGRRDANGAIIIHRVHNVTIQGNTLKRCCLDPLIPRKDEKVPIRPAYPISLAGGRGVVVSSNILEDCGGQAFVAYEADVMPDAFVVEGNLLTNTSELISFGVKAPVRVVRSVRFPKLQTV